MIEGCEQIYPYTRMEGPRIWQHRGGTWCGPGLFIPLTYLILWRTMWDRDNGIILKENLYSGILKGVETPYIVVSKRWDLGKDGSNLLALCWTPMTVPLQVNISYRKHLERNYGVHMWLCLNGTPKQSVSWGYEWTPTCLTHMGTWLDECVLKVLGMCLGQVT